MASPQKENGYTPISNELLDQIIISNFNATQLRIIFAIFRYTYGFHRKSHVLSLSYLATVTGTSKRYVSKELKNLIDRDVIKVTKNCSYTSPREISVNKNYEQWGITVPQTNNNSSDEQEDHTTVEQPLHTTVEQLFHQENKNINKNIKKEQSAFFESVWSLYPNKKGKARVTDKTKRKLYDLGYDVIKTCIERYISDKPDWKEYQHGSTFFASGYVDYLDDNYAGTEKESQCQQRAEDIYGRL